jgi:cytidyltransferase-like protein
MPPSDKVITLAGLSGLRDRHPGKKIAFCTGCFDIVHSGHPVFFQQCREHADLLIVGVGDDDTVRKLKGESRPVNPAANRLYLIAAFEAVDYVLLNGEVGEDTVDFREALEALRPDLLVVDDEDTAIAAKAALCDPLGVELVTVPRDLPPELIPTSTSQIIETVNYALRCPLRIDFAGGWTDIPFLMEGEAGFVSNAAIRPLVEFRDGNLNFSGYPRGSGLTTSTAAKMLEMLSAPHYVAAGKELRVIAEDLFSYENRDLHWAIGRQDMYVLTYGAFNCLRCETDRVVREPNSVTAESLEKLRSHLVLMHTSQSRNAQTVVEQVHERYKTRQGQTALTEMVELGQCFCRALEASRFDECGAIMHRNWEQQKALAPASSSPVIDEIYEYAQSIGGMGKLCGAGGGGAFVFYAKDPDAFLSQMKTKFSMCFEIEFDFEMRDIKTLNGL